MVPYTFIKRSKILRHATHMYSRETWKVSHDWYALQLLFSRTATTITPATEIQELIVNRLLAIILPCFNNIIWLQWTIISIIPCVFIHIWRSDKMGQYFGTIDTTPTKSIIRHVVKLIPAQLGRHKSRNITATHNLWQSSIVTKGVRQPDKARSNAKLLLSEACPVHNLPYK